MTTNLAHRAKLAAPGGPGRLRVLGVAFATALVFAVVPAGAASQHSERPVLDLPSVFAGAPVVVGSSTLVRTDRGLSTTVETTGLTPGNVVTLWWVVFNNPSACVAGIPGVSHCGPPDEFTAAAQPSILAAAGRIVASEGSAR